MLLFCIAPKVTPEQLNNIEQTNQMVKVLAQQQALPGVMSTKVAQDILARCYPLHPIAAFLGKAPPLMPSN